MARSAAIRRDTDVAIIGMACRFAGAANYRELWQQLRAGRNATGEVAAERRELRTYYAARPEHAARIPSTRFGSIGDLACFDFAFFGLSERDAAVIDPQQRVLLEEAWHCIEDAGVPLSRLQSVVTATYVGASAGDYRLAMDLADADDLHSLGTLWGTYPFGSAARIAHELGFRGKALAIDAACASALHALCEARNALTTKQCDYALCAGVKVICHPLVEIALAQAGLLSVRGSSRPFDAAGDGHVPGEGVGVLLLQRLDDAVRDRSHIHGVIAGAASNHTGSHEAIMGSPSVRAQREVIVAAYEDARIDPAEIDYIEAHSVGSAVGDAVELQALSEAFGQRTQRKQFCRIGSIKANIGHTDAAAGMAGVIKALSMMRHREIVKTLNYDAPNPLIDLRQTPFTIATENQTWLPATPGVLRASVNAFGIGGSNTCVVLESPPEPLVSEATSEPQAFLLSARSSEAFRAQLQNWRRFVATPEFVQASLADVCRTQACTRHAADDHRLGAMVRSKAELVAWLERAFEPRALNLDRGRDRLLRRRQGYSTPRYCLALSGWQFSGFEQVRAFFGSSDALNQYIDPLLDRLRQLRSNLAQGFRASVWDEDDAPVYGFVTDYGTLESFRALGLSPSMLAFEGSGAAAALTASGMLAFEDAVRLLARSASADRILLSRPLIDVYDTVHDRVISAAACEHARLQRLLDACQLSVASVLAARQTALLCYRTHPPYRRFLFAGASALRAHGMDLARFVRDDAYARDLLEQSNRARFAAAHALQRALDRVCGHWRLPQRLLCQTEAFAELHAAISQAYESPADALAWVLGRDGEQAGLPQPNEAPELWAQPADLRASWLSAAFSSACLRTPAGLPVVRLGDTACTTGSDAYLAALIRLWCGGVPIQWDRFVAERPHQKIPLPNYPFERTRVWHSGMHQPAADSVTTYPSRSDLERLSSEQLDALFDRAQV